MRTDPELFTVIGKNASSEVAGRPTFAPPAPGWRCREGVRLLLFDNVCEESGMVKIHEYFITDADGRGKAVAVDIEEYQTIPKEPQAIRAHK
jgi:hypothetical protein